MTRGGPVPRVARLPRVALPDVGGCAPRAAARPRPRRRRRRVAASPSSTCCHPGRGPSPGLAGARRSPTLVAGPGSCCRPATTSHWAALAHGSVVDPARFVTVQHGPAHAARAAPRRAARPCSRGATPTPVFWQLGARRRAPRGGRVAAALGGRHRAADPTVAAPTRRSSSARLHGTELPRALFVREAAERSAAPSTPPTGRTPPSATVARAASHARWEATGISDRPVRHPAARARRAGRQRVLHRRARGRGRRAARLGHHWPTRHRGCRPSGTATTSRRGVGRPRHHPNGPTWSRPVLSPRSCGG